MQRIPFLIFLIFFTTQAQQIDSVYNSLRNELIEKGRQSFFSKDIERLKSITIQVDSLFNLTKDSILLAKYYHFKALENKLRYENDSAFYYYYKSKDISKAIGDSLAVGRRLLSVAVLQRKAKDYLGSEISSIESLQYLEPLKSYNFLESLYNNLGLVSKELNQDDDAIKYYQLAHLVSNLIKDKRRQELGYLRVNNNLGLLYQKRKEHETAIKYFLEGLRLDNIKKKYPLEYALLLENLTFSQYQSDNKTSVLSNYKEVISLRKKENDLYYLAITNTLLSRYYSDKKQLTKAKNHANEAIKYAKQTHNNKRWLEALQLLSELTKGTQSKTYLQEYITLNDSLIQKERELKNQFAKIRYETDKKEKENTFLKEENSKKEVEIYKERQLKLIAFFIGVASIIISVLLFMLKRKKLLYKTTLQKTEATYKERDRIAQELHDGILGKLFGTRFGLGFVKVKGEKEEVDKYHKLLNQLQEIEREIRDVSHKLSYTTNSTSENYSEMITKTVREKSTIGNFSYDINTSEVSWSNFNEEVKFNVYRIIQEALHNIIKHSKAKNIIVSIYHKSDNLILEIKDDGVGFNIKKLSDGVGLTNIKSRVHKLKGTFNIDSKIGIGSNLKVEIPILL